MKKLLFCLVLAACVLLSGCSKPKPTWSTGLEAAPSVTEPDTGGLGAFLVCDEQLDDGVQFQLYDDGRLVLSGGDILQSVPDSLLFQMYQDKITSLELGDGVGVVANGAFSGASKLQKLVVGSSVREIGTRAFSGCTGLTQISFGNGLEKIGDYAFSGCTGLQYAELGSGIR